MGDVETLKNMETAEEKDRKGNAVKNVFLSEIIIKGSQVIFR